jgi:hypothetical protein
MTTRSDRRIRMHLRRVIVASGVTVLALAAGAVAVGASPFATASDPARIDIITRATAINDFVDVGPAGPSPGDIYVFVDKVFFADAPTREVGEALGRCTLIDPASARLGCNIRTSLPGGSLTTDGTLINVPGATSTGAITGGTGKFRNARGEGTLDLGAPEGPHEATFHVILVP